MTPTILHIPEYIDNNEILVRFIFVSDFKNKKIEVSKINDGEVFLDTRDLGVSLQRYLFCNEVECKELARSIQNKAYLGFVVFKKDDFLKVKEEHIRERKEFEAEIIFTPLDKNNQIIQNKSNIYTNTPKNPSHSDLYYLNPAVVNNETPKTAIRQFSRKLCQASKIIIDDSLEDLEYSAVSFSNFF